MTKIKIVTSWSNPGGGTVAHIGLTNLFNDNGYDCTFYGPHDWHLDKCKGESLSKARITAEDILLSHFIQVAPETKSRMHVLSCHETNLFPLKEMDLKQYDLIQFVSNFQRKWHSINHPSIVIPPVVNEVLWENPNNNIAGVIGSIDHNKQTHKSIQRAIEDGYNKVLLFGDVTDLPYFNTCVSQLVNSGKAILMGHQDNREFMYGQVSEVYHSSIRETYGLVEAECRLSGIPFNGPSNKQNILEKEEILNLWKQYLKL